VASGDTDGDGSADVVTGAGAGGGPHVKIFSGSSGTELQSFFAFDSGHTVGLFVAAGDLDGDGKAEAIAGVADGPSRVRVYEGKTLKNTFTVWGSGKPGGVRVGTVDITGDGIDEIIAGNGPAQFPTVKIFNPNDGTTLRESPSFVQTYTGGVFVG
ncbi:MAG: FG-GAP repeat domain-containing protein, partial [Fimbriiglobus sp.]